MKGNRKILFSFVIIAFSLSFLVNVVHPTTYYEWIKNGSFDDGLSSNNVLYNGGFESNLVNWTITDNSSGIINYANSTFAHNSSQCILLTSGALVFEQNLSTSINLGSIMDISLYWKGGHTGSPYNNGWLDMYIQYNGTSEIDYGGFIIAQDSVVSEWTKATVPQETLSNTLISGGDTLVNCKLLGIYVVMNDNGGAWVSVDDVVVSSSTTVTQMTINTASTPWYCYFGVSLPNPVIEHDTANTGVFSCFFEDGASGYYNTLLQDIDNLPSNNVYSITMYALDASGSGGGEIQFKLKYSDDTYSYNSFALSGIWQQYTFTSIVTPNKTITQVLIKPIDLHGSFIYVDDISILATEVSHTIDFHLAMNPSTLWITTNPTGFANMAFGQYLAIDETASVSTIYDGTTQGNGTFIATSSKGSLSGTLSGGILVFGISARTGLANNTKETINLTITSDVFNGTQYIDAYWYTVGTGGNGTTTDTSGSNLVNNITAIALPAILYILCVGIGLWVTKFKFVGLLVGINIGTFIYMFLPSTSLWVLPFTILIDVVLVVFRPKGE